jgi:hypothetical protein
MEFDSLDKGNSVLEDESQEKKLRKHQKQVMVCRQTSAVEKIILIYQV